MKPPEYDYLSEISRTPILQHPREEIFGVAQIDVNAGNACSRLISLLRDHGCSFAAISNAYLWKHNIDIAVARKLEPLTVGRLYRDEAAPYRWGWLVDWRMCNGKSLEPVIRDIEMREFFTRAKLLKCL